MSVTITLRSALAPTSVLALHGDPMQAKPIMLTRATAVIRPSIPSNPALRQQVVGESRFAKIKTLDFLW